MTSAQLHRPPAEAFRAAHALNLFIGSVIDRNALLKALPPAVRDVLRCERVALLIAGVQPGKLSLVCIADQVDTRQVDGIVVELDHEPAVDAWRRHEAAILDPAELGAGSSFESLFEVFPRHACITAPASADGVLYGVLVAQDVEDKPATAERAAFLGILARTAGIALANAWRYQRAEEDRGRKADEMNMLAQIDRELGDSINQASVFALTLDWAMRFTLAHAAYLSMYDEATGVLRVVASLGYEQGPETISTLFEDNGIPQRVAVNNRSEIVPDVGLDTNHVTVSIAMRSHLSVPVTREDRVIAVISVESRRLNAFTDAHIDFIVKLSARAGIAIDNARLYTEAVRQREQTESILREIADVVVVVGHDDRIILINPSAINVLRLYPDERYIGRRFSEIFEDQLILPLFKRAVASERVLTDQIMMPGDRPYTAVFAPHSEIGWIITMHDLTELRRADQIKRDFIAVLSHDLKQPVSVVKGYVELLEMQNPDLNERSRRYLGMIFQSIENMRKLIDDMLDLARLDSGIEINRVRVSAEHLVVSVQEWIRPAAEAKGMHIEAGPLLNLPDLRGDETRLMQILVNLVHNAVKYTPPGGLVRIEAEHIGDSIRFSVRDNGIGISADDLKAIFDRFFRVRRPETENIEGSGVGLALVKKLVDMHDGQIGVESRLGEGTTFYVTLPVWR